MRTHPSAVGTAQAIYWVTHATWVLHDPLILCRKGQRDAMVKSDPCKNSSTIRVPHANFICFWFLFDLGVKNSPWGTHGNPYQFLFMIEARKPQLVCGCSYCCTTFLASRGHHYLLTRFGRRPPPGPRNHADLPAASHRLGWLIHQMGSEYAQ